MSITPNSEKCCGTNMTDWSFHGRNAKLRKKIAHFYCRQCGSHFYGRKWYTKDEWFFYINEVTYAEYQRRLRNQEIEEDNARAMESIHVHEIINHSDPEGE